MCARMCDCRVLRTHVTSVNVCVCSHSIPLPLHPLLHLHVLTGCCVKQQTIVKRFVELTVVGLHMSAVTGVSLCIICSQSPFIKD